MALQSYKATVSLYIMALLAYIEAMTIYIMALWAYIVPLLLDIEALLAYNEALQMVKLVLANAGKADKSLNLRRLGKNVVISRPKSVIRKSYEHS